MNLPVALAQTHRQRILHSLLGKETDRTPLPMWLGFAPWGQTLARWREESGLKDLNIGSYFEFEPFFQVVPMESGPYPHFKPEVLSENDGHVISKDWRGITVRNRQDGMSMPEFIDHPIHQESDWLRYKEERLALRVEERLPRLAEFVTQADQTDAPVQVGCFPWGVFGSSRDLLGLEGLLVNFYDEPEMIHDIMETLVSLWLAVFEEVARHVQIDHIHIWEDMAGKQGSLISPAMIETFMMPQYDRIAAFAQRNQVSIVSVDSDGRVDQLVRIMTKHGINAFFPFEVQAGSLMEDYRAEYPELSILGGLDKRCLAEGKVEMHRELDRAEFMLSKGRYILGFDHLIPPDVPWVNYEYFITQLKKMIA